MFDWHKPRWVFRRITLKPRDLTWSWCECYVVKPTIKSTLVSYNTFSLCKALHFQLFRILRMFHKVWECMLFLTICRISIIIIKKLTDCFRRVKKKCFRIVVYFWFLVQHLNVNKLTKFILHNWVHDMTLF